MGETLDIAQGAAKDFLRQILNRSTGQPFGSSPFLSTDTLACAVWPGDSRPAVIAPQVAWADATGAATFLMSVGNADSALLSAQKYAFRTLLTRGNKTGEVDSGWLRVKASPGAEAAALAFTTYDDLTKYCSWIENLQPDTAQAGFQEQQARATTRLIDAVVNMHEAPGVLNVQIGQPGWNAQSLGLGSRSPSWWLRQQIVPLAPGSTPDALYPDRLTSLPNKVDPRVSTALLLYDEVKEVCARWAISYVLRDQVTKDTSQDWWRLAAYHEATATGLFRSRRFEIDLATPQTGYASITVSGGSSSLR